MNKPRIGGFGNLQVLSFESRKAKEMATLISNHGGIPLVAPAMREIPLEENPGAFAFAEELFAGRLDAVIFMTGVGARGLLEVLETRHSRQAIVSALSTLVVVARGSKPVKVLQEFQIPVGVIVPEPNTWREVLMTLDRHPAGFSVQGKRIAVQEYGVSNIPFLEELRNRGTMVSQVPVYRWGLPENLAPLRQALKAVSAGQTHVLLFTNAQQVGNVLTIASEMDVREQLLSALRTCVVCSIGPTCSAALQAHNIGVDLEPEHPKMGMLVLEAARSATELLHEKTAAQVSRCS